MTSENSANGGSVVMRFLCVSKYCLFIIMFLCSYKSIAHGNLENRYDQCFAMAEKDSGIDKAVLKSIAKVESNGNHLAIGANPHKRGFGIGLMQIDSQHLDFFKKKYNITAEDLLMNECINIYAGVLILKKSFIYLGPNWTGVGAYNAGLKRSGIQALRRESYAKKVKNIYHQSLIENHAHAKYIESGN